jgi:hypothetical protein
MRTKFLEALRQPLADIEVAGEKLERFHNPIVLARRLQANAETVERALETVSLGLAIAEVYLGSREEEGES